jgi:hypothetical protein
MSKARELANLGNAYSDGALSNRNLIINGAMTVSQRGDLTGVTSDSYFVDRFEYVGADEGTWSLSQASDAPSGSGFTKSAKLEITTADSIVASGDYAQFRYTFENQDIKHILKGTADAKQVTLSFWVKSSLAQDFQVRLRDNYSSTSRQIIKSYAVASANTWQHVILTFDGDTGGDDFSGSTDTDGNFILDWLLGGGANFQGGTASGNWEDFDNTKWGSSDTFLTTVNSTFYITGVQLEVGDTATPFEHRSYGDELARCQRYYYTGGVNGGRAAVAAGYTSSSTSVRWTFLTPVNMRASPTYSAGSSPYAADGGTNLLISSEAVLGFTSNTVSMVGTISGSGNHRSLNINYGSGENFKLDAEL